MQAVIITDKLQLTSQPKQRLLFNADFLTVLHETYSSPNYKKQLENFSELPNSRHLKVAPKLFMVLSLRIKPYQC